MLQAKYKGWLHEFLKRYIHIFKIYIFICVLSYKRLTSELKTHRMKVRTGKKIFHVSGNKKVRQNKTPKQSYNKRQKRTLYNHKGNNHKKKM